MALLPPAGMIGRAVKADIKSSLAVVDQINDLVVGDLCHQTTGLQLFVQSHRKILLFLGQREKKTPSAREKAKNAVLEKYTDAQERLDKATALLGRVEQLAVAGEWTIAVPSIKSEGN